MATMNTEQLKTFISETTVPLIKDVVGKEIGDLVRENVEAAIAKAQGAQTNYAREMREAAGGAKKEPTKIPFGAYVRALAAARNDKEKAVKIAKQWGYHDVAEQLEKSVEKAMSAGDPLAGGFLVPTEFSNDVIELLRATSTVRSLNPTMLPMPTGTVKVPKVTAGATATYIGENSNISKSEMTFGQLTLTWKKLAALVPVSNDLIRYSGPSADGIVRDDVVRELAKREDLAFLRDDGLNGKPKGIKNWIHASNKFNANATVNLANVTVDLGKALQALIDADINLVVGQAGTGSLSINPGWIFAPRTWRYLSTVQNGNGFYAYRDEMLRGTLWGWPYRVTTQIPIVMSGANDTGGNQSEVYFGAFSHAIVGEAAGLMVDASDTAAYHDGSNVIAAYSQDQTVIRVIAEHDFALRYDKAFALIQQVTYGA